MHAPAEELARPTIAAMMNSNGQRLWEVGRDGAANHEDHGGEARLSQYPGGESGKADYEQTEAIQCIGQSDFRVRDLPIGKTDGEKTNREGCR
jgi:hypothetical protein